MHTCDASIGKLISGKFVESQLSKDAILISCLILLVMVKTTRDLIEYMEKYYNVQ